MNPGRRSTALFGALLALLLALAGPVACGKRGDPKPPDDKPVTHPRGYPAG